MQTKDGESLDALLRAANRGDDRAYALFLRTITPIVRNVARARGSGLGNDVCEDVVQDTLLAIHLKRDTWQEDRPVKPWLYAIVRYKVVDAFRARGRRVHVDIADFSEVLAAPPDEDLTERSDVERVISHLDERSAHIVRAIGLQGETVADVAKTLDMTETAVRVALHRGLKKLSDLRERMIE